MKRLAAAGLGLVLLVVLAAVAWALAIGLPRNAAGMVARSVCSGAFVAGRPWQRVLADDVLPATRALGWLDVTVDPAARTVSARLAGGVERRASHLGLRGCVLDAEPDPAAAPPPSPVERRAPWPEGDAPDGTAPARLHALGEGRAYGAQTWLIGHPSEGDCRGHGLPPDALAMRGHWGQLVAIVPSRQVVAVRLGWTLDAAAFRPCEFVAGVLKAVPD